jgi:hypothetical protein
MDPEYAAVVDKVEAFTRTTFSRRAEDMACSAGCEGCCHVWLSLSEVEAATLRQAIDALDAAQRAELRERGRVEALREARGEMPARCAMLDAEGRCVVYAARPLVCRTQGHALGYPSGVIPVEAVRLRTHKGEVTACSLNFVAREPEPEDILDAERVDQLLALVNRRFCERLGLEVMGRHTISSLAQGSDVLDPEASGRHERG